MESNDSLITSLAMQIAELRSQIDGLQNQLDSNGGGSDGSSILDDVGGGGSGGCGSYGAFRIKDGKIVDKFFMVSRSVCSVSGEHDATAGTWSLVVPHDSFGNAYLTTQGGITDDVQTVIPLYTLNDSGEIVRDYRGMPFVMLRE